MGDTTQYVAAVVAKKCTLVRRVCKQRDNLYLDVIRISNALCPEQKKVRTYCFKKRRYDRFTHTIMP